MDYKWIGLEQKWIGSRKLDFLFTPNFNDIVKKLHSGTKLSEKKKYHIFYWVSLVLLSFEH